MGICHDLDASYSRHHETLALAGVRRIHLVRGRDRDRLRRCVRQPLGFAGCYVLSGPTKYEAPAPAQPGEAVQDRQKDAGADCGVVAG